MSIEVLLISQRNQMDDLSTRPEKIYYLTQQLKVLAEPNRLLIINLLMQGTQCNCMLGDALNMAPNLISHHLGVLREAGLVHLERDPLDARWVYYSINCEALTQLNAALGEFLNPERVSSQNKPCSPELTPMILRDLPASGR